MPRRAKANGKDRPEAQITEWNCLSRSMNSVWNLLNRRHADPTCLNLSALGSLCHPSAKYVRHELVLYQHRPSGEHEAQAVMCFGRVAERKAVRLPAGLADENLLRKRDATIQFKQIL